MITSLETLIVVLTIAIIMQIACSWMPSIQGGLLGRIWKYFSDLRKLRLLENKKNFLILLDKDADAGGDSRDPEYKREIKEIEDKIQSIKNGLDDIPFRWLMLVVTFLSWLISGVFFGQLMMNRITDPRMKLVFVFFVTVIMSFGLMIMIPLFEGVLFVRLKISKLEKKLDGINSQIDDALYAIELFGESTEIQNPLITNLSLKREQVSKEIEDLTNELKLKIERFENV